jgi:L-lysine 6-transaminase
MKEIEPKKVRELIGQHLLADVSPIVVDIEKSKGNRLFDAVTEKFYLDCISYVASNAIGHNHPKMFDPEFEKKLLRVARTKPSNSDFFTREMAEFVDTFVRIALPPEFKYLFFVEGGSVAVENGIKAAIDWKIRLNNKRGIKGERGSKILHFLRAFHGRTGYALSVTNTIDERKTKLFPKLDWPRISNPKITFPMDGEHLANVIDAEWQSLYETREAFRIHGNDIAAILIEPIQGEGGDCHFRAEFHQELRKIADEHEALLIYDEVQSGVGLTGKMWAYQHYGIVPDIVSFGKKMQVCGIMVSPKIDQVEDHVFKQSARINSTWGGSLTDMVRAQRYLEIIEEEKLVENAAIVGAFLLEGLEELSRKYPVLLRNARGKGLMCAINVGTPELRDQFVAELFKRNVLILKCGRRSLRLRPSLTFSKEEVREMLKVFEQVAKLLSN